MLASLGSSWLESPFSRELVVKVSCIRLRCGPARKSYDLITEHMTCVCSEN